MAYKQLTFIQRCRIYGLWRAGCSQTEIAKEIGVHKSTICRELQRNIFWWGSRIPQYRPHYAQSYTEDRRKRYGSPKRNGPIRNRRFIDERPAIVAEMQSKSQKPPLMD